MSFCHYYYVCIAEIKNDKGQYSGSKENKKRTVTLTFRHHQQIVSFVESSFRVSLFLLHNIIHGVT